MPLSKPFFLNWYFEWPLQEHQLQLFFFHLVKFKIERPIVLKFHHFKGTQSFRCDSNLLTGLIFHNKQASISSWVGCLSLMVFKKINVLGHKHGMWMNVRYNVGQRSRMAKCGTYHKQYFHHGSNGRRWAIIVLGFQWIITFWM